MGGFVAENFIDDRLGLFKQPSCKSNAILGRIGAPDGAGHPSAEPHIDFRSEFVKLPQAQAGFEIRPEPLNVLGRNFCLSGYT